MHETEYDTDPGEHERPAVVVRASRADDVTVRDANAAQKLTPIHQVTLAVKQRDADGQRHRCNMYM